MLPFWCGRASNTTGIETSGQTNTRGCGLIDSHTQRNRDTQGQTSRDLDTLRTEIQSQTHRHCDRDMDREMQRNRDMDTHMNRQGQGNMDRHKDGPTRGHAHLDTETQTCRHSHMLTNMDR